MQGFGTGEGEGDGHRPGGVEDVIPDQDQLHKGMGREKLLEWEPGHGEGASREREGSEQWQGFRDGPAWRGEGREEAAASWDH